MSDDLRHFLEQLTIEELKKLRKFIDKLLVEKEEKKR